MKIYNYSRKALTLMAACVLFLMDGTSQARSANPEPQPVSGSANLIIRRLPNLGNNVAVILYVDGVAIAPVGYGRTYEGYLSAGRHLLSVRSAPDPRWRTPWQMSVDVSNGQVYTFTAMDDGSGDLVLKRG
jgi:hypothetical protein